MKRIIIIVAALCACMGSAAAMEKADSTAQTGKDRLEKLEELADKAKEKKAKKAEKFFNFDLVEAFGWGYHLMGDKFSDRMADNFEIWFNALQLTLNPADWLGITLGLDLKWDRYKAGGAYYLHPNNINELVWDNVSVQQALYPAAGGQFKTLSSQANIFSLALPLALDFRIGSFGIRAGAEAVFPVSSKQKERAKYGDTLERKQVKGFETAAYFKYVPVEIIPGIVDQLLTIGVVCGF